MTSPPPLDPPTVRRRLWQALPTAEARFIAQALRQETLGGILLLIAVLVAIIWANSPWDDGYESLRHLHIGPLSLEHWAADGGQAVFFFLWSTASAPSPQDLRFPSSP